MHVLLTNNVNFLQRRLINHMNIALQCEVILMRQYYNNITETRR